MRIRFLIQITCLLILCSCGTNGNTNDNTGAMQFGLEWKNAAKESLTQVSGADVCVDFGIDTIQAKVYDDVNSKVSSQTWSWSCSDHQGSLTGIPPGSFRFELEGLKQGTTVWQGSQSAVIEVGKTTDVGTIALTYIGSDKTAPAISSVSPVNGALNVPLTSGISVTFSEPMAASTINSTAMSLKNGSTIVPCSVFYNQTTKTATLTPTTALLPSTTYTIVVTYFPTDMAGNFLNWNNSSYDGSYSYNFVTVSLISTVWKTTFIDAAFDSPVSIALDKNNGAHISYVKDSNSVRKTGYATNATGSWVTSVFNSNNSDGSVIVIDSNDKAHIIYDDFTLTNKFSLIHLYESSGTWNTATIDNGSVGYNYDVAIDSLNILRIGYTKSGNSFYSASSGTSFSATQLPTAKGSNTSIALANNNAVHVFVSDSYYLSPRALYHLTNASGSWVSETVATGGSYSFHSSVVDSGKHLHICYLDGGKLKYATNLSGSWVSSQLTIADAFGLSLAIDSTDHLHVSFYDKTQGVLNYATNNSGAWTIVPVDSSGNVGWYNAIAVDSNKKIHIGYFDMTNGKVKYATNGP